MSDSVKCPIDGKSFKTKAALSQHKRAKHSQSGKAKANKPSRSPKGVSAEAPMSSRRARGTDMLGLIEVSAPGRVGLPMIDVPMNPRDFIGTRLHQESLLWTRWRPLSLKVRVQPSAGSYVSGSYIIGWTGNPSAELPGGQSSVRKLSTYRPNAFAQISGSTTLNVPTQTSQKWYLLEGNMDDSTHGAVQAVLSAQLSSLTQGSSISVYIHLDWDIEFSAPDVPGSDQSKADVVYADTSYTPYHSTSMTSFNEGKTLILKHTAGGSAVPMVGADPTTVYKFGGTSLVAKVESGGSVIDVSIEHAALARGNNFFVLFADRERAEKYVLTGNANLGITYHEAGPSAEPSNPPWIALEKPALLSFRKPTKPRE